MTYPDPFASMQAAVDIVEGSPHPTNKVAATLFGEGFSLSKTNYWPESILKSFGTEKEIGNSSGTIHAETACIFDAPQATENASLCVTDPFCPNCAKNIAEAGIRKIYIDHKGFDKDFFQRRSGHFKTLSMLICEKAGISVYELWRKDCRLETIYEPPKGYVPSEDSPVLCEKVGSLSEGVFTHLVAESSHRHEKRRFALVIAHDKDEKLYALTARGHVVTGFTMEDPEDVQLAEKKEDKYTLFQEPVNRLLMYMARRGLKPVQGFFYSSQVPSSREQVNLVGAGVKSLNVGDLTKARDGNAMAAMRELSAAGILRYA
jgi:deoxycytidylate deaminase